MSATEHPRPDDDMPDREGLASEYVLGTLPLADRAAAERLIATDPGFAALVEAWQDRLAALNDDFTEVSPPADLLNRVEARLFPVDPAARSAGIRPVRSLARIWLGALSGLAVAGLVAFMILRPPAGPPPIAVTLTGTDLPLVVAASYQPDTRRLTMTRSAGPAADTAHDYELWIIPAGQKPVSLGVMHGEKADIALDALPPGSTLAITLEQTGGSPTGQAQGPLLVSAVVPG